MSLYEYSLVRCVPAPRTGEFINIGAIAGSAEDDSWDVRQIQNERRAARICAPEHLAAVHEFLALVADRINTAELEGESLPGSWLADMHADMRNVVQLSEPQPAVGTSATSVLDVVFDRMVIDPERVARSFISKATLLASLRHAYRSRIERSLVLEKPEVYVGSHLRTNLDFAVGAGKAVQICQAWSFQKGSVDDVSTEVKSWGYALGRLRDGEQARVISRTGSIVPVQADVEIDVLFAEPQTPRQQEVYEEAREVFDGLGVTTFKDSDAERLGDRAADLVAV